MHNEVHHMKEGETYMRIQRYLAACVLLVVAAGFVFAAGGRESTDGQIEIRVLTRWASDAPHEVAFQDLLREFDEMNPNVTIVDESVGEEIAFNDRLRTSIATGNTPDVVYTLGGAAFREFAANGVYLDLQPHLDADPEWRDFFLPLFENWQFEDLEGTFGVPYESFGVGLFYNRQLFDEHGLDAPRTIEDFERVADAFLEAGIVPLQIGNQSPWRGGHLFTNMMLKRHGAGIVSDLANRNTSWDSAEVIEVLELLDDWHSRGYFGPNVVAGTHNEEQSAFHAGDTAMHMNGSWYIGTGSNSAIGEHMGFVPFPYFSDFPENRNTWMGGAAGGISLSGTMSETKEAVVVDLLKHLTSPEAFAHIQATVGGGVYPVRIEADPDAVDALTIEYAAELESADELRTDVDAYDPLPQMTDRVRNSIQGMFAGQSPAATAQEIQREVERGR